MTKNIKNPKVFWLCIILLGLSIIGCGISLYLSLIHYWTYTDSTYSSFCAISQTINCDTVAQSPWSIFLGIPLSQWGVLGYLVLIVLLVFEIRANHQKSITAIFVIIGILFTLLSGYLGYLSSAKINAFCLLCILTYIINFLLLIFSCILFSRTRSGSLSVEFFDASRFLVRNNFIRYSIGITLMSFALWIVFLPDYWNFDRQDIDTTNILTGITDDGQPWMGAEDPRITIEVFSDFLCSPCAKVHHTLRQLAAEHPESLRIVFRHYPMDHEFNPTVVPEPFHIGAGKMALIAVYAARKGKFWEISDLLFQIARSPREEFDTAFLEEKTGIPSGEFALALQHPLIRQQLDSDILAGMRLNITATPSFLINGKVYTGAIPEDLLKTNLPE